MLLRTCVQSAVGMLRDQNEDLSRSRKRIEILLGLFSKEDELKGVCCRECPWASGDHQNTSVRSLGTQGSWLWCSQGRSPRSVCPCSSLLMGVGLFLLFRWWLFLWLCWLFFSPADQFLKQLSNAVLGGIFGSKLIEEKIQVPCCFVASFLKITKARLSSLLKKQEENSLHPKNWVLREASNLSALQEAGTFR